ncbi:hypothetical protein F5X97DRAFT_328819 [Nemania serpens]|nr:hypothetical protein F5X97DRAFT_328819 [Nemania serpens]
MPPRKRTRDGKTCRAKKQKTTNGPKPSQPAVSTDEGFKEGGDVHVHIDHNETI